MKDPGEFQEFINIANSYLDKAGQPAEELDHWIHDDSDIPEDAQQHIETAIKEFRTAHSISDINSMFKAVYESRDNLRRAEHSLQDSPTEIDDELFTLISRLSGRLRSAEKALEPVCESRMF